MTPTGTAKAKGMGALLSAEAWGLNQEQSDAFNDDGNTVVVACPGSGKTRLIVAKAVKYVLRYGPKKVMLVTFSRPAADEMRERIAKAIGKELAEKIEIGTYHALSHKLLRAYYKSKKKEYKVVQDGQSIRMIKEAKNRVAPDMPLEEAIAGIARIKATVRSDDDLHSKRDTITLVYFAYQEMLRDYGGKDFADLIRECNQLFAKGDLAPFPVKYLLGDENQDTDRSQYGWILQHHRAGSIITCVGDDDQSIYGFRNAMGHLSLTGLAQETGANMYFLKTNYRCGRNIVYLADNVIQQNLARISKQFQVGSSLEGAITLTSYKDEATEAEGVIRMFEELVDSPDYKPVENSFAAMSRTNFGLDYIEMAATGSKYSVIRDGKSSFLDRPHVRQTLAILRLGLKIDNKLGWHEAASISGMSDKGLGQFDLYMRKLPHNTSMMDAVYVKEWLDQLEKQDKTLFSHFRNIVMEWQEKVAQLSDEWTEATCSSALTMVCQKISDLATKQYQKSDIGFLGRILSKRLKGSVGMRLAAIAMKKEKEKDEGEEEIGPVLRLMTLHGSKGLQFDAVFLMGLNEASLPMENSDVEEERRLFYVGITRAISYLYISYVKEPSRPSRFLDGIIPSTPPVTTLAA